MRTPVFSVLTILTGLVSSAVIVNAESAADRLDLLILHNNDMHSRFEETSKSSGTCKHKPGKPKKCIGGFARTVHEVRKYRKLAADGTLGRKVLFLNAGDTYTGTAWFSVHKWKICAEFMNALQPDAVSLGNHEFDNGIAGLAPFLDAATFPILAANIDVTPEPSLSKIKKSTVIDISGRKVGIVGHVTNETKIISSTGNVIFHDMVASIRDETEALDRAGVKIIIVVGHSGYDVDKRIAEEVPLADIVIGGHTNTFQWNGQPPDAEQPEDVYPTVVQQGSGKKVPVVQAYAYTKYLGRLNVSFDANGDLVDFNGQPQLMVSDIAQDQDILDMLDEYRPEIDALDKKVIGKTQVVLESTGNKCRQVECNFGNMIADAFVFYTATLSVSSGWNDAPISLMNGGGIRTTIEASANGQVTRGDLLGAMPFGSQVVTLKLKGLDLIRTLEIGARSNGETSKGEFLQVSGLKVTYDMDRPTGSRVVSVRARCGQCRVPVYEQIDPNEIYNVTTTSFLTDGGDGHTVLKDRGFDKKIQDVIDVDAVEFYIQRQSPVYPEEQGRIAFASKQRLTESPLSSASTLRLSLSLSLMSVLLRFVLHGVI